MAFWTEKLHCIYPIGVSKGKNIILSVQQEIAVYLAMWAKSNARDIIFISDSQLKFAKPMALKAITDSL